MLETLRRSATGIIAKILLGFLIISFGIWGIKDVFRGYGEDSLATVGEEKISENEYKRMLNAELNSLSIENERRISLEDAKKEGIDRLVLSKMIAQSALEQQTQRLKLALSMQKVAEELKSDPTFLGPDGKFSRLGFEDLLSRLGISESFFLSLKREDELRQQITSALMASTSIPKTTIEIFNSYRNETRTIDFFKIDPNKSQQITEPDEAKLKTYYEDHKSSFVTQEYRKFNLLIASVDELKKDVSVSDDEMKSYYEENKKTYDIPEKRRIQQLPFQNKTAAEEARELLLKGGKNFMDIAKNIGAKETDINLGLLSKEELIDQTIANAAFELERDALSEVLEGKFSTVLLRVIEIEPGHLSTYEESKDKVRDKLASQKATVLLQEKIDLVEESRNAGKTFKEIAEELKLKFYEIPSSDNQGKSPDNQSILDIENPTPIIRRVFQSDPGAETDPIELGSNGYAWIQVLNIEPPQQKLFDAVVGEVKKNYLESEKKNEIKDFADKLIERLQNGEDFASIASVAGGTIDQLQDIKRNQVPPGLTEEAIKLAFTLPLNGSASALTSDRSTRTIFKISKITKPPLLTKQEEDQLTKELNQEYSNDILVTYVQNLQDVLGVRINEGEFKRALGVDINP